jgi:glycosyltransferase involved in cell wall biosynthesis
MTFPLISVICPTYRRPQYLPTAIRCFFQQTYPNKEMIIVDDDGLWEAGSVARLTGCDDRVTMLRLDSKTSTGTKRNLGAEAAIGSIVCNFDDDDFSHPHRLEDQFQRLLRSGKAVTGYCRTIRFDEASRELYTGVNGPPYFVSGTSQMYMKAWWELYPYPDATRGEDSVFSRTARLADELAAADPGKMMVIRNHGGNTESINPGRYKRLTSTDVSSEFFRAHDAPVKDLAYTTEPHVCTATCRNDMAQQANADVGQDYKITSWPEIPVR